MLRTSDPSQVSPHSYERQVPGVPRTVYIITMKKNAPHLSVLALIARQSFGAVLLVLLITTVLRALAYQKTFSDALAAYNASPSLGFIDIESLFTSSGGTFAINVTRISLLLISFLLCRIFCERGSRCGYTLMRLRVTERGIFVCHAIYAAVIYLLFYAAELLLSYAVCLYYLQHAPAEYVGPQTLFLAFYRSNYLHSLLPLADIAVWVRNGFLYLALSLAAAEFPCRQRRRHFGGSILALCVCTLVFFIREIGDAFNSFAVIFCSLCCIASSIYFVFFKNHESDEETEGGEVL